MPYKDPEKQRERNRKYYEAHKESLRKKSRKTSREYREANPDKVREAKHRWYVNNIEKAHKAHSQWNAENPEKTRARRRRWRAENPERATALMNKYRSLKAGNGGSFTAEEWLALCAQYNNQCIGPGPHRGPLTADHVIPVGEPSSTSYITNIQPLCQPCNTRKGHRTIDYRQQGA